MSSEIQDKVRDSLEQLATGFKYDEKEIIYNHQGKQEKIRVTQKYSPPRMDAIKEVQALIAMGAWK